MTLLLANLASSLLLAAGMMVLIWVLLRRSHRAFGRRRRNEPAIHKMPRPSADSDLSRRPASDEQDRWTVDMHETARDLSAQLDSKMSALQALILRAREEQARLQRAIERAEELPPSRKD